MESTQKFEVNSNYIVLDIDESVIITLQAKTNYKFKKVNKHVLLVLDVSGSMSGSPILQCKQVMCELISYMHEKLSNKMVDLITFNDQPKFYQIRGKPYQECSSIIHNLYASGGTAFIPVFDKLKDFLSKNKIEDLMIIFLSDGEAEGLQKLKPHIESFKDFLTTKTSSCEVHTIGFSASHDAALLNEMTNAGTAQGTFQYIKESSEIKKCLDAISGIIGEKKISGEILNTMDTQAKPIRVFFEEYSVAADTPDSTNTPGKDKAKLNSNSEGVFRRWDATINMNIGIHDLTSTPGKYVLKLKIGDYTESHGLTPKPYPMDNSSTKVRVELMSLNGKLKNLADKLTQKKLQKEESEEINSQLIAYRKILLDKTRQVFKLKIADREPLFVLLQDITEYINTFTNLIKQNFIGQLSNEQIAIVNSLAYREITRKGLLKKIDKRASKSVPILNEAFQKVKEIANTIDEAKLTEKYQEKIDEIGCCALTCSNFVEALKSEDCLCISFDIGRPEIAIVDCTRVSIKKIFPTIICATAFIDSVKYAIKINAEASGGFDNEKQGSIVKGISAENITAVLPIYICPEHWEIAKLLMKPILGWNITLDPIGYQYFQKKVIPFLLLIKSMQNMYENSKSKFNNMIYRWLMETCINIVKDDMEPDFGGTMKEDVLKVYNGYLIDGTVRTSDIIQSNLVTLSHFYVFSHMDMIKKPNKIDLSNIIKFMIEEEIRRRQEDTPIDKLKPIILGLFDIDLKKCIEKTLEESNKEENKTQENSKKQAKHPKNSENTCTENELDLTFLKELYATNTELGSDRYERLNELKKIFGEDALPNSSNSQKNLGKPDKEEIKEVETKNEDDTKKKLTFTIDQILKAKILKEMSQTQQNALKEYEKLYKDIALDFLAWFKYFYPEEEELDLKSIYNIEYIGIDTPSKFLCLYIQNKLHTKNADRRAAHNNKKYKNPFNETEAQEYLLGVVSQIVDETLLKNEILNAKKKKSQGSVNESYMDVFLNTYNLDAAAGYLCFGLSLGEFQTIQNRLRTVNKNDEYTTYPYMKEKLQMIKDKSYDGVSFSIDFNIRKRFMRKIYKKFLIDYNYNEWKELWFK